MSLIGNLEDLSLPDILQIISLSKKSGILIIQRGEEEGKIYIRQGKVILSVGLKNRRNIGNILIEKGLVTPEQLAAAVAEQKSGDMKQLLGAVLVQMSLITPADLEKVVHEQIEESVYYFLTWKDGTFKFDLKDVDERLEVAVDPQFLISHRGIDTQWLVMEGTRLIDERKRKGAVRGHEQTEDSASAIPDEEKIYLLVDDDDYFCDLFIRESEKAGRQVQRFAGVGEALEFLSSSLGAEGFFMIIDVVMPTTDGRGFLGGLELVRKVVADYPEIALKVITAYPDESVLEELGALEIPPYVLKPALSNDEKSGQGIARFIEEIFRMPRRAAAPAAPVPAWAETPPAPADTTPTPEAPAAVTPVPETPPAPQQEGTIPAPLVAPDPGESLTGTTKALESTLNHHPHLKLMVTDLMGELHHARTQSEVVLIILRLASELLDRAILLKTTGRAATSLGGFGFEASTIRNRDGLRNVSIDVDHSPLMSSVLETLRPARSPEDILTADDIISVIVGDPVPTSWVLLPGRMSAESTFVLYGDLGQQHKTIDGSDVMSLFVRLASLVIRRIREGQAGRASAENETVR
jgi:ActR/RegA family two-component response regulator